MTITGGHAHDIDEDNLRDNFQELTYFRGGGILVDGNWDSSFDENKPLAEVMGVAKRNIPLMLTACLIKDNEAANGGGVYTNSTFYAFSCHFTKNLAEGPNSEIDQQFIPWTAGGAVANNYECHLWNCLFDNNEARKGEKSILTKLRNNTIDNPVNFSNERQGYGGVISC